MHYESNVREPLILGDKSYKDITVDVARPVETAAPESVVDRLFDFAGHVPLGRRLSSCIPSERVSGSGV